MIRTGFGFRSRIGRPCGAQSWSSSPAQGMPDLAAAVRTDAPQAGPGPAHPRPRSPILRVDTEPSILAERFGAFYSEPGSSRDPR
jgi:hypothetical protein